MVLDVEFAEVDMEMKLFGTCRLTEDWGYRYTRADEAVTLLSMPAEEENAASPSRVLVAVIDSGVDYEHPLLRNRIWVNEAERDGIPGVDDDGNGVTFRCLEV